MHMLGIYQHIAIMTRGYLKELTYLKSSPCFWRRVAGIVPLKLLFAKLLRNHFKISSCFKYSFIKLYLVIHQYRDTYRKVNLGKVERESGIGPLNLLLLKSLQVLWHEGQQLR